MDKKSKKVICTNFCNGRKHDFQLFKDSKVRWQRKTKALTDSGYVGISKIQISTELPKKYSKKHPLTKSDKKFNRKLSSQRALNENVIGFLKRFKIISDRYRNRRKRFGLRFNLISGICNRDITI